MHYVAFAVFLLACPALTAWLRVNPHRAHWAYFGLGLLPFTLNAWNLDGALVSWGMWPGYAKGMVITLEDSLALAVVLYHRRPRGLPPLSGYLIVYLITSLLSVAQTDVPMGSLFYPFQLLRILILLMAVAKVANDPRALNWLAMGLAAGVIYQVVVCINQKLHGAFQTAGTLNHQNLLGLMTEYVLIICMSFLLGGTRNRILMLGVVSSFVILGLAASRGAVLFSAIGIALFLLLSVIRRSTPRKWRAVGFIAFALALTSPLIIKGMHNRMGQIAQAGQSEGIDKERLAFERAAKAMIADHPMGVGANQYVVVANTKGYSKRAGVIWNWTSRSANVHNTYLLVAAETGWLGLAAFGFMYIGIILAGLRFAFQDRRDPRGEVALACTVATFSTALHIQYEWIWVLYQSQYILAISTGILAGLIRGRKLERRELRRRRAMEASGHAEQPMPQPA